MMVIIGRDTNQECPRRVLHSNKAEEERIRRIWKQRGEVGGK